MTAKPPSARDFLRRYEAAQRGPYAEVSAVEQLRRHLADPKPHLGTWRERRERLERDARIEARTAALARGEADPLPPAPADDLPDYHGCLRLVHAIFNPRERRRVPN